MTANLAWEPGVRSVGVPWKVRTGWRCRLLALLVLLAVSAIAAPPYAERYRPQYHFTPQKGWMGDPDGCIRYRGLYHLFWWGHAVSPDLVYWTERPWPMLGGGESFMYYTGSVVVDDRNTGGWGTSNQPAMVAVYTAHERASGMENQRLSISTDHEMFHYYEGNPVLDLKSKSFRDPDVFWHEPSQRWIMVVALPDERKFHIYASNDLKAWQFLSAFGPYGARDGLWEVPVLFQLPLNGDPAAMKWVLLCSMGPNKIQYFVGDFDGRRFAPDRVDAAHLTKGAGLEGEVFEDFEGPTIGHWAASGSAFGEGPFRTRRSDGGAVFGFLGRGVGGSAAASDEATGTLRSPSFTITRNCINFLIAGGDHPGETCINLMVDGQVVRSATGSNSDAMKWRGWTVAPWLGKEATIELVDQRPGPWGHVSVDHIMFSDVLRDTGREHANWVDWGPDFYAARVFRDYDHITNATVWIGWMGNWDYAHHVPTSWGRGAQSIPRELELVSRAGRYGLFQRPLPALQKLRGPPVELPARNIQGLVRLPEFRPARNTYELEAVFERGAPDQHLGLHLCVGESEKLVVGYDAAIGNAYLDRTSSGQVSLHGSFPCRVTAPLFPNDGPVTFRVFVDQSSVEVFVNGGQAVLTAQLFPDPGSLGVELFSLNGEAALRSLSAWELRSIWRP